MTKYDIMVREVLDTRQTIGQVAKQHGVYKTTLSKYVRETINLQTVDDVIRWCKNPNVVDTRKIISPRDSKTKHLYDQIVMLTSFLPSNCGLRERLYYIENNTKQPPACECGNNLGWNTTSLKGFNRFCSDPTCRAALHSANTKRVSTNLSNRGVKYAYLDSNVRDKRNATMIAKYGNVSFNASTVNDGAVTILMNKELLSDMYLKHKSTFVVAEALGVSQAYVSVCMQRLGIKASIHTSRFEHDIFEYITTQLGVDCGKTRSVISPKEIDIFAPDFNVGIECNGVYWHSDNYKTQSYHKDKTNECTKVGVRLVHLFENEYTNKPNIVKSRLSSIFGKNATVGARQCTLRQVVFREGNDFFNATHIQGGCKTMSTMFGLYHGDELVACMGFSRSRFNKHVEYELIRYSSKLFTNVVGGASKLFKAFRNLNPTSTIVSYSDNRWNTGSVYEQLGFTYSHTSQPNYFYFKDGYSDTILSRTMFQKHKLSKMLNSFSASLTEYENMKNNGYSRIWDCGNTVWIYTPTITNLQT